ncbi:Doc2bp, partial [Tyrophagus putrescentiae]
MVSRMKPVQQQQHRGSFVALKHEDSWVCPNDRELTLRARLETGWSVKSNQFQTLNWKQEKVSEQEKKMIIEVLSRAQKSNEMEERRISKMAERLSNMKRSARGNGEGTCILCNESFGLFGLKSHLCRGCKKLVCSKCGVDTHTTKNETVWYCKICSESREIVKKSGSWFHASTLSTPPTSQRVSWYSKAKAIAERSTTPKTD